MVRIRYKAKLELLSPIHVGLGQDGREVKGLGFVTRPNQLFLFDDYIGVLDIAALRRIWEALQRTSRRPLRERIREMEGVVLQSLGPFLGKVRSYPLHKGKVDLGPSPNRRTFHRGGRDSGEVTYLYKFIGQEEQSPFIPGSSLKGSIKRGLCFKGCLERREKFCKDQECIQNLTPAGGGGTDPLGIRDAYFPQEWLEVSHSIVFHEKKGFQRHLEDYRMVVPPGRSLEVEVVWDPYGNPGWKDFYSTDSLEDVLQSLSEMNKEAYKEWQGKFGGKVEELASPTLPSKERGEYLLFLGFGGGKYYNIYCDKRKGPASCSEDGKYIKSTRLYSYNNRWHPPGLVVLKDLEEVGRLG